MQQNNFLSVFERGRRRLLETARSFLGSTEDAEDVLQDVFIKLWQKRLDVQPREMEAFISRAVHNQSIDELRRRRKRTEGVVEMFPDVEEKEEPDIFPAVQQIIESALTPLQKDILESHDVNGESYEDIAERLDMQPPAIRMQLSRARKTIRDQYRQLNMQHDEQILR